MKLCTFSHGAFGFEPKPQTVSIWWEILQAEPFAGLESAAQRLVRAGECKKPPSPAELLRERDGHGGNAETKKQNFFFTNDAEYHEMVKLRIDAGLMPLVQEVGHGKFSLSFVPYMPSLHEKCPVRIRGRVYPGLRRLQWGYERGER